MGNSGGAHRLFVVRRSDRQALLRQTDETGDNAFKEKMQRLMKYMQYRHFHTGLECHRTYYAHLWHSAKCLDEAAVVVDLPGPLRMEIAHCSGAFVPEDPRYCRVPGPHKAAGRLDAEADRCSRYDDL